MIGLNLYPSTTRSSRGRERLLSYGRAHPSRTTRSGGANCWVTRFFVLASSSK
jgi:hypothetical protein